MNTFIQYGNRATDIRSGIAECAFLFLLRDIRQYRAMMHAFQHSWRIQLISSTVVDLDEGLTDETARLAFLQFIQNAKKELQGLEDPVPGEILRELAKGTFDDYSFSPLEKSKILSALKEIEDLVSQ